MRSKLESEKETPIFSSGRTCMRFLGERGAGFLLSSSSKGFGFVPEKGEGAVNPCEPDPGAQQQEEEQLHEISREKARL